MKKKDFKNTDMIFGSYSNEKEVQKTQTMEFCKVFCAIKLAPNDRKELNLFDQSDYDSLKAL